jgi:hypothetical protein
MKQLFIRTLHEAFPYWHWQLKPIYTIGVKMEGKAMMGTYSKPIGRPRRIWGSNDKGDEHTPASLVSTVLGIPIMGGMFNPEIGKRLGWYPWQCATIIATTEGRTEDPAFDPEFRGEILALLGLREP